MLVLKKAITYDTADVTLIMCFMTYLKQEYLLPFYEVYPALKK